MSSASDLLQALGSLQLGQGLVHEHHMLDSSPAVDEAPEDLKACPSKDCHGAEPGHAVVQAVEKVLCDGPLQVAIVVMSSTAGTLAGVDQRGINGSGCTEAALLALAFQSASAPCTQESTPYVQTAAHSGAPALSLQYNGSMIVCWILVHCFVDYAVQPG